jgi:hypothetical protein
VFGSGPPEKMMVQAALTHEGRQMKKDEAALQPGICMHFLGCRLQIFDRQLYSLKCPSSKGFICIDSKKIVEMFLQHVDSLKSIKR